MNGQLDVIICESLWRHGLTCDRLAITQGPSLNQNPANIHGMIWRNQKILDRNIFTQGTRFDPDRQAFQPVGKTHIHMALANPPDWHGPLRGFNNMLSRQCLNHNLPNGRKYLCPRIEAKKSYVRATRTVTGKLKVPPSIGSRECFTDLNTALGNCERIASQCHRTA